MLGVPAVQSTAPEPRRATSCFFMPLNPSEEEGNPPTAPTAGRGARGRLPCFPTGKEWEQGGKQRSLLPKKGWLLWLFYCFPPCYKCGRDKQLVDNPLAGVLSRSRAKGRWVACACSTELRLRGDEEGGEESGACTHPAVVREDQDLN